MSNNLINISSASDETMYANDKEFVEALVLKENSAWSSFLKQYRKICLIIACQHDVAHIFDELFSNFILKLTGTSEKSGVLEKYDGSASLKTYLSVIFRRIVFDYYRNKNRKGHYVLSQIAIDNFPDCKLGPVAQFDESESDCDEKNDYLWNTVNLLPKEEQNLIELYYYNEFSLRQIGKTFGWSKSKVARRLETIYEKLRKLSLIFKNGTPCV